MLNQTNQNRTNHGDYYNIMHNRLVFYCLQIDGGAPVEHGLLHSRWGLHLSPQLNLVEIVSETPVGPCEYQIIGLESNHAMRGTMSHSSRIAAIQL